MIQTRPEAAYATATDEESAVLLALPPRDIAFFHQNEALKAQGGIERYLSTLLEAGGNRVTLVTEETSHAPSERITVRLRGPQALPRWVRYCAGVVSDHRRIRRRLATSGARVMEFSRPEYALFAWMFPGKRVFTFHGMGPNAEHRTQRLIHDASCFLLPLVADAVQIVGRDRSALPRPIRAWFRKRTVHVDAWFDDRFKPSPLPPLRDGPLVVFYAGRISVQKNPEVLFGIIRDAATTLPFPVEFRYFGADYAEIEKAGLADRVVWGGMLDPPRLARAMAECHAGILCSKAEGSPFAIVEALACGRCFVASPLAGLVQTYGKTPGMIFAEAIEPQAFLAALARVRETLLGGTSPEEIAAAVSDRSQSAVAHAVLDRLRALETNPRAFAAD